MRLTEIKDSDKVLPWKQRHGWEHDDHCDCGTEQYNNAIDAYNSLDIGGDVERLARLNYFRSYAEMYGGWASAPNNLKRYFREEAERIISQMPEWVTVRRGE